MRYAETYWNGKSRDGNRAEVSVPCARGCAGAGDEELRSGSGSKVRRVQTLCIR
jgi:hypothetical protein